MKRKPLAGFPALAASLVALATLTTAARGESANQASPPIPVTELGATAGAQYHGDGLSVTATPEGARLRCVFQKLEGQVTPEGLWLTSTAENSNGERFRVVASKVGRDGKSSQERDSHPPQPVNFVAADVSPLHSPRKEIRADSRRLLRFDWTLPRVGLVTVADKLARFTRPGLTEEYSVSVDGVRQDFVVTQRPAGDGALCVELDVTGAKAEPLANGARLVLDGSGRKIAYTRLHVVDAAGKELTARMEVSFVGDEVTSLKPRRNTGNHVEEMSLLTSAPTNRRTRLAVLVDDAAAKYPVRIDPTFSDDDWVSLGSGVNGVAYALAMSGSNLYVGGQFTTAGGSSAINVAKWNGSAWSALGSGVNSVAYALAASGSNLYVGGQFFIPGGNIAFRVARWDGSAWSALGSGVNGVVLALTVSGSDLYVGGDFTTAGGSAANYVAKWNGAAWSALGSGVNSTVHALAVSGSDLYVGGGFTTAGGNSANRVAKWDGSAWSSLESGVNSVVRALAVSGSDLYVGGQFSTADGGNASRVAKWDGITWSALASGVSGTVRSLAISSGELYVGGTFTSAGGNSATNVAKWDGNAWSALGSGANNSVYALSVSGSDLYVGGGFTTAGGKASTNVAKLIGPAVFTSIAPNPSGTEALLTYSTAPGASLHVLSSPDLIAWQTNTTVTATDVTNSVSVNLTQPQEFFRLRRLP